MKQCFKCGAEKPLTEFYRHPQMKDGHVNKCKECNKGDNRENRANKREKYVEYDRARSQTKARKEQRKRHQLARRSRSPKKYKANQAVSNAIRDGRLVRGICEVCGSSERVEGHHDDYNKPLSVRWLCFSHHREWHKHNEAII